MTTLILFHEVEDGGRWEQAWREGPGSRHAQFARHGVTARTFRDPENPTSTGLLLEVSDLGKWQAFLDSDEARQAMAEDGLKVETLRVLAEFAP